MELMREGRSTTQICIIIALLGRKSIIDDNTLKHHHQIEIEGMPKVAEEAWHEVVCTCTVYGYLTALRPPSPLLVPRS
jgi:hypothetical protein